MVKKAVILCGGLATRLLPVTKSIPKEMIPILNKPAIDYCVDDLKKNGITQILVILGRNKAMLEDYFDKNIELEERLNRKTEMLNHIKSMYQDVNIYFLRQKEAKGTGFATYLAKDFVGNEPFVLMYPDELVIGKSFTKTLLEEYNRQNASILPIKKVPIEDSYKYGMLEVEEADNSVKIKRIVEKPNPNESPSDICYTGGGIFTPDIFDYLRECLPQANGEIYLTDAFESLSKKSGLYGVEMQGERMDIGTPLGFVKSNILAGLQDENIKDDLMKFLKKIVEDADGNK